MLEDVASVAEAHDVLELPPTLDLDAAVALKDLLTGILAAGPSLRIDASKVQRVTSPCVQVLLAAARTAQNNGGSFAIHTPSQQFADAATALALTDALGMEGLAQ